MIEVKKRRDVFVDSVRGLGILLVVYFHAVQACNAMDSHNSLHLLVQTFQMPLFFLISGYCSNFNEPPKKNSVLRSVKRLLIPYVIWEQIHFFLSVAIGRCKYSFKNQLFSLFTSGYWFVRILFFVFLIYYLFFFIRKKTLSKTGKIIVSTFVGGGASCLMVFLLSRIPGCESVIPYSAMFLIGNIAFKVRKGFGDRVIVLICWICFFLFLISCCLYFSVDGSWFFILDKSMAITGSFFFVTICWILNYMMGLAHFERIRSHIAKIGTATLAVYSIHWCLLFDLNIIDYHKLLVVDFGLDLYLSAIIVCGFWLLLCWVSICLFNAVSARLKKK